MAKQEHKDVTTADFTWPAAVPRFEVGDTVSWRPTWGDMYEPFVVESFADDDGMIFVRGDKQGMGPYLRESNSFKVVSRGPEEEQWD